MIRPEDLTHFLESVRTTVAYELMPDLQSANQKANADALVILLDRILTDLKYSDGIAASSAATWSALSKELASLGLHTTPQISDAGPGLLASVAEFQTLVDGIQQDFHSESGFAALKQRLEQKDEAVAEWFHKAVDAAVALTAATRTRAFRQETFGQQTEREDQTGLIRKKLEAYLKQHVPDMGPDPVVAFKLVPGGYSKITALFEVIENPHLPSALVLRMDMANSVTDTTVADEFSILKNVSGLDLPVPEPLLLETDESHLGGRFLIMTAIENEGAFGPYFPVERTEPAKADPEFGKSVARTLATLHAKTRTNDLSTVPDYSQHIEQAHKGWKTTPNAANTVVVDMAYAWLLSHPRDHNRPWCRIHGDFGAHNMLIKGHNLVGLIDWELSRTGDPAEDLAQCRMMVIPGVMSWEDFVVEYIAAGGDPSACDERSVTYFCVWIFLSHLTGHAALRGKYLSGERTDISAAKMVGYYSALLTDYLAQSLQMAITAEGNADSALSQSSISQSE